MACHSSTWRNRSVTFGQTSSATVGRLSTRAPATCPANDLVDSPAHLELHRFVKELMRATVVLLVTFTITGVAQTFLIFGWIVVLVQVDSGSHRLVWSQHGVLNEVSRLRLDAKPVIDGFLQAFKCVLEKFEVIGDWLIDICWRHCIWRWLCQIGTLRFCYLCLGEHSTKHFETTAEVEGWSSANCCCCRSKIFVTWRSARINTLSHLGLLQLLLLHPQENFIFLLEGSTVSLHDRE